MCMCQTFKKYIQDRIQKSRNNIIQYQYIEQIFACQNLQMCHCSTTWGQIPKHIPCHFCFKLRKSSFLRFRHFQCDVRILEAGPMQNVGWLSVCKHLPCRMIGAGWLDAHTHESSPKDYLEKAVPVDSLCFGTQGYVSLETSCGGKKRRHIAGTSAIAAMFSTGPKHASQRLFLTSSCDAEEFSRNEGFASIRIVLIHFAILVFWARASRGFALYAFCVPICLFGNLGGNKKRLENS